MRARHWNCIASPLARLEAAARRAMPGGFRAIDVMQLPGASPATLEEVKSALELASQRLMENPDYPRVHLDHYDNRQGRFVQTVVNPVAVVTVDQFAETPDFTVHGVALLKHRDLELCNYRDLRPALMREANSILGKAWLPESFAD